MNHIIAELLRPEIMGPPLERGTRYGHHFVVELISDGRRLWAVASEEGRRILHQIEHGIGIDDAPVAVEDQSGTGGGPVGDSLDPEGKPATGGDPEPTTVEMPQPNLPPLPEGEAPTTTVSSANTFDS